jgi:HNH endonuclease
MKQISLTRNKFALVDDEDYPELSKHKWYFQEAGYAARDVRIDGKRVCIFMHRHICAAVPGLEVDHVNGDGLDNQRANLRQCTHRDNIRNGKKHKHAKHSKYKGVKKHGAGWCAEIHYDGHTHYLGTFTYESYAALAYNEAAHSVYGEFARLNTVTAEAGNDNAR